jgi:hypothetical protein
MLIEADPFLSAGRSREANTMRSFRGCVPPT